MKKITLMLILLAAGFSLLQAQPDKHGKPRHHKPFEKIKELEKIKLIEILDMDEETTLKFFSRRNEHLQKIDEINKAQDEKLEQIEKKIENSEENDPELIRLVNDYMSGNDKINSAKKEFINSVKDILSDKQVAKLVVFEKRFKEEVRGIIFNKSR